MTSLQPIKLLIVDDHQLIIDGLSRILESKKLIGEIFSANNGQIAVDIALNQDIDCVIMDINMPIMNGLDATKLIKKEKPHMKIIVVSMLFDAPIVSRMLRAGANAFINKDIGQDELLKAIEKVMNDEKYLSPAISLNLATHLNDTEESSATDKHLTPREIEIIRHIAEGLTNSEIAEKLFLSKVTVDTHRKNILAKLQLKNTATMVKYATDHKLL
jgi:DNA-binding NarL/FixJ family response regulator